MYQAFIKNGEEWYDLFHSHDERIMLIDPVLTRGLNKTGNFAFDVPPAHPNYNKILPYSEIYLYEDKDDNVEPIFSGRPLSCEQDFNNVLHVSCEGEMGYLRDTIQRPFEYTGSLHELFVQLVTIHNNQVGESKRFEIGDITVADNGSDRITRTGTDYVTTWDALVANLVNVFGGYLRARWSGGKKYLDYVTDYGGINTQSIRFGENLLDIDRFVDPTTVYTVLLPIGAELEDGTVVDITSVNDGIDYIIEEEAYEKFGWKCIQKTWEDETDPASLLSKAKAYLKEQAALSQAIELTAFDLNMIDVDMEKLVFGYWTTVESPPHNVKVQLLLSSQTTYLMDPGSNKIVLGGQMPSFGAQVAQNRIDTKYKIGKVSSVMTQKIENATQLITGGKGGFVVLDIEDPDTGKKSHPWRILIMDTPDKATAKSMIQLNKNGIGFSTTGIDGPYRNAWTIDGNLVADFITSGTMLADRIRGGILEVGGKDLAKNGKIVVKDANGKEIGYWDKTGLHVMLGVIEGTNIIGGTIDIGNGTFSVDKHGAVVINAGAISLGPIVITQNYADIGDYRVSSNNLGAFFSSDHQIQLWSRHPEWSGRPVIQVGDTMINDKAIVTGAIKCDDIQFNDPWTERMTALDMFKDLYNRIKG